jgi:hypothetical protein
MAENAGGIYVTIDGDSSPLLAKYAQAEQQSRAAGQRIATALGTGFQQATGVVDQFGRAIQSSVVKPLAEVAPAAQAASKAIVQLGDATGQAEKKAQSFVGVIPGLGRAAEHFINLLPGVGQAIMAAFPVLGAIALAENLARLIPMAGKLGGIFGGVSEEEKKAADEAQRFSDEIASADAHVRDLAIQLERLRNGAAAGAAAALQEAKAQADIAAIQLAAAKSKLRGGDEFTSGGRKFLRAGHGPAVQITPEAEAAQKAGSDVDAAQLQVQIRQEELRKQREADAKRAADEAARDARSREVEERRQAAETERQARAITQGVYSSRRQAAEEEKRTQRENQSEMLQGLREGSSESQRAMDEQRRELQAIEAERNRHNESAIRQQGVRQQSADELSQIAAKSSYQLQITHTRADELAYAQQIATLDEKALQDKIDNLQVLRDYQALNGLVRETDQTDLQIEQAKAALIRQQVSDQAKILQQKQQQSLGGQIRSAVGIGPATLFDAKNMIAAQTMGNAVDGIASAMGRAVQGGQRLGAIFKDLGKSIIGGLVSSLVKVGLQMVINKVIGSSVAVAMVTSAAAVGAANAAAATAAIPIIGPELAPAAAAATFAEIMAFAPLASFDKGGFINSDQIAQVHKGEYVLTAGQVSGRDAMPTLPGTGVSGSGSTPYTNTARSDSFSHSFSVGAIHLHGVQNVEDVAKRLPNVLKTRSPKFSPASRNR